MGIAGSHVSGSAGLVSFPISWTKPSGWSTSITVGPSGRLLAGLQLGVTATPTVDGGATFSGEEVFLVGLSLDGATPTVCTYLMVTGSISTTLTGIIPFTGLTPGLHTIQAAVEGGGGHWTDNTPGFDYTISSPWLVGWPL